MSMSVRRGASFRIKFYPRSNVNFGSLGTPFVTIQQELTELVLEPHVDTESNMVYADVSEEESITLVEDVETKAQLMFSNEDGTSYRFPIHDITVLPTLFGTRSDEIQNKEEQEPLPSTSGDNTQSTDTSGDNTQSTDTSGDNTQSTDTSGDNTQSTDTSGDNNSNEQEP